MARSSRNTTYAGGKFAGRFIRAIPYIGTFVAVATLGAAVRRKGWLRGALHTGLDAIPYVGGAKNMAEVVRGRDFLADRARANLSKEVS